MAVPDFQSLTLPVLRALSDAKELRLAAVRERVASALGLAEADLSELLPSGRQPRFNNRVNWAAVYLTAAGLAKWVRRGVYSITDRGREVLLSPPERIDVAFLQQFPEFVEWKRQGTASNGSDEQEAGATPTAESDTTPEEQIEVGYQAYRKAVEAELLTKILASSPTFFEELVVGLLVKMGYGGSRVDAGRALGRSGDGGVDGMIKEDRLGLDAVYVQAKRWEPSRSVSRPEVQAFAGSLEGERARKGVFITTARFTAEAHDYVKRIEKKIVLVDGKMLTALMFEHGVGVRTKEVYEIREVDDDYFGDE